MPTRRETKAATRQRLVDAAIAILDEEGEGGLTTTGITRRAGIAQSSFYVHFDDVNALLQGVVDQLSTTQGRITRHARRLASSSPEDRERLRDTFRVPLMDMIAHPHVLRIVLRSRHDRATPLGEWARSWHDVGRRGLLDDLVDAGLPRTPTLEMFADGLISLTETMALGHLEGRYPDIERAIDVLIAFAYGPWVYIRDGAGAAASTSGARAGADA